MAYLLLGSLPSTPSYPLFSCVRKVHPLIMLLHAEVRGAGELRARVVQPIHFLKLPHTRLYAGRLRDYPHCMASR